MSTSINIKADIYKRKEVGSGENFYLIVNGRPIEYGTPKEIDKLFHSLCSISCIQKSLKTV